MIKILFIILTFPASVAAGEAVLIYNDLEKPGNGWIDQDSVDAEYCVVVAKRVGYIFKPDTLRVTGRPILRIDTVDQWMQYHLGTIRIPSTPTRRYRYDTIFVDTTRFYAQVDMCLTCPLGWDLRRFSFGLECLMRSSSDCRQPPDTTLDTTYTWIQLNTES